MFMWSRCCWRWRADSSLARCPCRQVLRTNPYEVVKAGSIGAGLDGGSRVRDVLLVVQIAICAVLVTSSLVAVRGLVRSLHSNFGFEPQNAMLVDTDLSMAGYSGDRVPADAKAHDRCPGDDSRRRVCGIRESICRCSTAAPVDLDVFTDKTTRSEAIECRRRRLHVQHISRILRCGGHSLAGGQSLHRGMTTKTRRAWQW